MRDSKKLTKEDILYILKYHTDTIEVGELSESEWAAKLIEDYGYTIVDFLGTDTFFNSQLKELKKNFPSYRI